MVVEFPMRTMNIFEFVSWNQSLYVDLIAVSSHYGAMIHCMYKEKAE